MILADYREEWNKTETGYEQENSDFFITENQFHPEANVLYVTIERNTYEIANGDLAFLFATADRYYEMLSEAVENDLYDTVDLMPLPMTDEIRIFDGEDTFEWGEPIPFTLFMNADELRSMKTALASEKKANGAELFAQEEVVAFSEDGSRYPKVMEIFRRKGEDRFILSFGAPCEYELDLFLEDVKNNTLNSVCIDAAGRNHDNSAVYIYPEDISPFIKSFLSSQEEKGGIRSSIAEDGSSVPEESPAARKP